MKMRLLSTYLANVEQGIEYQIDRVRTAQYNKLTGNTSAPAPPSMAGLANVYLPEWGALSKTNVQVKMTEERIAMIETHLFGDDPWEWVTGGLTIYGRVRIDELRSRYTILQYQRPTLRMEDPKPHALTLVYRGIFGSSMDALLGVSVFDTLTSFKTGWKSYALTRVGVVNAPATEFAEDVRTMDDALMSSVSETADSLLFAFIADGARMTREASGLTGYDSGPGPWADDVPDEEAEDAPVRPRGYNGSQMSDSEKTLLAMAVSNDVYLVLRQMVSAEGAYTLSDRPFAYLGRRNYLLQVPTSPI
jgi:hypothetical protein